ncbi:MAG: ChaN family lipoprotein [Phycisphaerales bacterium]
MLLRIVLAGWIGIVIAGSLGACASRPAPAAAPRLVPAERARALPIFDRAGAPVEWKALVSACAAADAVLIGEAHGQPEGQAFEEALFRDVLAAAPGAVAALEFFERDQQPDLDDYLLGVTDEAAMRTATSRSPSGYPPGHRAMVEASRAAARPVIAANAPRRYVRLARTDGYERLAALSPSQRALFRIPSLLPQGRYRDDFFRVMGADPAAADVEPAAPDAQDTDSPAHGDARASAATTVEGMFRAQSLWDWTMADSVARALGVAGPAPETGAPRPVVLVVGVFHVEHGGGLVQALRLLRPDTRIVTVCMALTGETSPRAEDKDRADFVVHVGPSLR